MNKKLFVIGVACVFVCVFLCKTSFSISEEVAARQWDAVRGTTDESTFLINLILQERPGPFPEVAKKRFYEIVTPDDAVILLKVWINPSMRKQRSFALTLLRGLKGDEYTELFEEYLYLASDARAQRRLYNLITHQNSLTAYRAAIKYVNYVHEKGLHRETIFYLQGVKVFNHPEIRQELIDGTDSESNIIRAASYKALRNYPDDEVLEIINHALSSDTGYIPGEENRGIPEPERYIRSDKTGKNLIQDILKGSKRCIEHERRYNNNNQLNQESSDYYPEQLDSTVSASSTDQELAKEFAPQIRLSYGDYPGVDLTDGTSHPYTDYVPIYVNNATNYLWKNAYLHLHEAVIL